MGDVISQVSFATADAPILRFISRLFFSAFKEWEVLFECRVLVLVVPNAFSCNGFAQKPLRATERPQMTRGSSLLSVLTLPHFIALHFSCSWFNPLSLVERFRSVERFQAVLYCQNVAAGC